MRDWITLQGRIGRKRFWTGFLVALVLAVVGDMVMDLFGESLLTLLALPLLLAAIVISLSNTIRRLHDLGLSGWLIAALGLLYACLGAVASVTAGSVVPQIIAALTSLIQLAVLVALGVMRGQSEPNRFGDPPPGAKPKEAPAAA